MSSTAAAIQVTQFVRALALAWKNLAAYPAGHPALVGSLRNVDEQLSELRGPAGEVLLGVAADGLVYGTIKVDSPAAQKFAQALYMRGVALLRLGNDTTPNDLETFLRLLAAGGPTGEKRVLWEDLTAAGVTSINLQPVSYSAVRVSEGLHESPPQERSLWDEILGALMENRRFAPAAQGLPRATAADDLSTLLSEYVAGESVPSTFDPDATFGIRLHTREEPRFIHAFLTTTIGDRIARATGFKKQHALEQALQVLQNLAQPLRAVVLRGVLQALSGKEEDAVLLRDFTSNLPSNEVLDALRYLSSRGTLSRQATALLDSLTGADHSSGAAPPSESVLADLMTLFGEEDLSRFNAPDANALLASARVRVPEVPVSPIHSLERLGDRADTVASGPLLHQFADLLVDLLGELGSSRSPEAILRRIESLVRSAVAAAEYDDALSLLDRLERTKESGEAPLQKAIEAALARLADGTTIRDLVDTLQGAPPEKADALKRLVQRLAGFGGENLLEALAEENNRSRRRRLFDFIVSLGPAMVPGITSYLGHKRWYVVRNMIALLRALGDRTSLSEIRKLASHADLRVRMEAIKSLLALDKSVPATLLDEALSDPDPKLAETAIGLVGAYGIREGVDPLLRILEGNDVLGKRRPLRVKALRALGEIAEPDVLPKIERFFRTSLLPWPSREERYAAWESLQKYPGQARAALVERGARSSDPRIRAICTRLSRS